MRSEAWLFEIASEMEMRFTELNWDGDGMVRGNDERRKRELHSSTRKRSQAQMLSAQ
jgi:intein/homing endonuclease